MIVKIELEFDMDCDTDKEMYGEINAIIAPKDEDCCGADDVPDYESAYSDLRETIVEMLDEAKPGTATHKVLTTLMERTEEIDSEQSIER